MIPSFATLRFPLAWPWWLPGWPHQSQGPMFMGNHSRVPWQLKIAAKVILARVPISPKLPSRAGLFQVGGMRHPQYAVGVFRRHFEKAVFARKDQPFVTLELGPGF